MNSKEFRENYHIEPGSKGIRATPKHGKSGEMPDALTGDGEVYDPSHEYFFYDPNGRTVRSSDGIRRVDDTHLGSLGLRIIAISELRATKDAAIDDGVKVLLGQIQALRDLIVQFEAQKRPENRSLKAFLMSGK